MTNDASDRTSPDTTHLADGIREHDLRLGSLIRNNPLPIVVTDADRCVQICNPAFETLFGYVEAEVAGKRIDDVLGVSDSSQQFAELGRRTMGGHGSHLVTRRRRKDGSIVDVELHIVPMTIDGRRLGAYAIYRDLTDEKRAQNELGRFFAMSQDLLCMVGFDGFYKRLNPSWERMLGHAEEVLLAQPYTTFVHPDDRDATLAYFDKLRQGEAVVSFENRHRCRDGSFKWLQWSAMAAGEHQMVYAVARDNTSRHALDQQLRETLEMKSDFVSFVTHQLRTPLSGIKWMLELATEASDPTEVTSYIQDGRDSTERLIALVNDLLDVSRLESGKLQVTLQPVDLGEVTNNVLGDMKTLIEGKDHTLTVTAPLSVDLQLIRQVVLNLISNAVKYTPNGGRIDVNIGLKDDEISWAIRDTGIGIPHASQTRLFEKFYRAENALPLDTEGTGLGLYLARLIVERFGGTIACQSEVGQGTTVTFRLPVSYATSEVSQ